MKILRNFEWFIKDCSIYFLFVKLEKDCNKLGGMKLMLENCLKVLIYIDN